MTPFIRLSVALQCVVVVFYTAGCSHINLSSRTPELTWPVLPSAPIDCVQEAGCTLGIDVFSPEVISQRPVDLNSEHDLERSNPFSSVTLEVDKIFQEASLKAEDAQNLNGKLETTVFSKYRQEPRQLPPRPEEFGKIADAYRQSKDFHTCQTAFYALEIARDSDISPQSKKKLVMQAVYIRYVSGCFTEAKTAFIDRLALIWTNWPGGKDALGFYCLGFDIDGTHVLTAKHCLATPSERARVISEKKEDEGLLLSPVPGSRISFADEPTLSYTYKVSALHKEKDSEFYFPFKPADDVALLELEVSRKKVPFSLARHESWDRIVTFTSFYPYEQFLKCLNQPGSLACTYQDLIRIDPSPNCVSPIQKDACLLHACQTRPGSSGGPILAIRNGQFFLIGVHTGSIAVPEYAPCSLPRGDVFPNFGLSIDSSPVLIEFINRRKFGLQ